MSICGENVFFHGHTYARFTSSGLNPASYQTAYSMESDRVSSDLTVSTLNPHHLGLLSDQQRPFVGPHGMANLPLLDHWPSPPLAHNHHMNNVNNNSINNNSAFNSTNGTCIQSQCNNNNNNNSNNSKNNNNNNTSPGLDGSVIENINNNNTILMKNSGDCPAMSNMDNSKNTMNSNNNSSNVNNNNNTNNNIEISNSMAGEGDSIPASTRQNQVGTILLHGVAIVSLIIDNKERLCLAQISNTLLKEYSYNEIHNRRVALGITCVQCTPVQLEILRRAGAMPVSSRRCGMITKREAERLVKSFLEDNDPPKLPEDFAFDVIHECGWGCRGLFEPARYNSSRAKCIKCMYCSMYFSPNKFIFHFHRTPGAKYNHPDAANFNSWRRHLKLYQVADKDEIMFKWEDVKAMFNGGTRKRIGSSISSSSSSSSSPSSSSISSSKFSSHLSSSSHNQQHPHPHPHHSHQHHHHHHQTAANNRSSSSFPLSPSTLDGASSAKKAKTSSMLEAGNAFLSKQPAHFSNPFNPYGWLATPHNKAAAAASGYPFMGMNTAAAAQSMCFGFPPQIPQANKDALMDRMKSAPVGVGNPAGWMNRGPVLPFQLASMDLLWDKTFGFPSAATVAALGSFRNGGYQNSAMFPGTTNHNMGMELGEHMSPPRDNTPCISPNPGMHQRLMTSPGCHERGEKAGSRISAFTRVVPSMSPPSSASLSPQHSNHDRNTPSRHEDEEDDNDDNAPAIESDERFNHDQDADCLRRIENGQSNSNSFACDFSSHRDIDDAEEIDVEDHPDDKKRVKCNSIPLTHREGDHSVCRVQTFSSSSQQQPASDSSIHTAFPSNRKSTEDHHPSRHPTVASPSIVGPDRNSVSASLSMPSEDGNGHCLESRSPGRDSALSEDSDTERDGHSVGADVIKEEISCEDMNIMETGDCKKEEIRTHKDHFREEVSREQTFQEHMSKQLEMLRETLTTELEHERKIRYSLQEKLKQAHEALNSFSCGLLASSNNSDPSHFKDANSTAANAAAVVPR